MFIKLGEELVNTAQITRAWVVSGGSDVKIEFAGGTFMMWRPQGPGNAQQSLEALLQHRSELKELCSVIREAAEEMLPASHTQVVETLSELIGKQAEAIELLKEQLAASQKREAELTETLKEELNYKPAKGKGK